jgi:hypothetical protein
MNNKEKVISHLSHGMGDAVKGHHGSNIAQDGTPKRLHAVAVHDGMKTKSQSGQDALSGHHASALDAMSGATVPAGKVTAPGWGNASARTGNPMAHAPASKNVKPVRVHPSQTKGADHDQQLADLGRAILAQAVRN